MDKAQFRQVVRKVLNDKTKQPIHIRCKEAMMIITTLNLAAKHPRLSKETRRELRLVSRPFEEGILSLHPDAKPIIPNKPVFNPDQALATKVIGDELVFPVYITIGQVWLLVCGVQAATRHPDVPADLKETVIDLAHQLENTVIGFHPEAEEAFDMGWDESLDE